MESKHTPAPWIEIPQSNGSRMIALEYETGEQNNPKCLRLIANVIARKDTLLIDEANARLVASAPELLEALKAIVQLGEHNADCNHSGEYLDARKIAIQAIAKAEGA